MEPLVKERANLSKDEAERFSRHLILPNVGREGQERLKASSVLIVGTGGLGSPLALYLAAAGIGRIGLVDYDVVDETNLQRQIIHGQSTVGLSKLDSAEKRIKDLNPYIQVDKYNVPLMSDNALEIMEPYDVIVDGTDNFPTRYLVNDACVKLGKPNVYGSIFRFEGQVSVFWAEHGPCYRCMFPSPPPPGLVPSCAEGGVLGILPGTVGTMQATEVVKLIVGMGEPMIGKMLLYDALDMDFSNIRVRKDPKCPVCGIPREEVELIDYEQFCGMPAHDHSEFKDQSVQEIAAGIHTNGANHMEEMSVQELKQRMDAGENLYVLDVRNPVEWGIADIVGTHKIAKPHIESATRAVQVEGKAIEDTIIGDIPNDQDVVVFCRSGVRSADVIGLLKELGYQNKLINLTGGILAWADEIDPSLPKY